MFKGFLIGLSIAAPVGPIGVLCIRRTFAGGRTVGFVSGLGAASADAIYGCVAAFGLTFISNFLIDQQFWLRLIGGLFLCFLGIKTLLGEPSNQPAAVKGRGLFSSLTSTFVLTLTNPMTILSFAAIFSGLGLAGNVQDYRSAGLLVLGVFLGSLFWWFLLSAGVSFLREKITVQGLRWVNRLSGMIILGFGVAALIAAF
ncbi:MAG: LysE family transporter [Chloroflexi bacterium]|nr:LysE family transporter [Chloroflexota bacterium]